MTLLLEPTVGQSQRALQRDRIGALAEAYHLYRGFEGAILVADSGESVYTGAFGLANREWQVPNTVDTRFSIASVTKPFTAALVVLLSEQGALDLQVPISTYLPEYRRDIGDHVSAHHLLTHTSGIPNYAVYPEFWAENPPRMKYDHAEFIRQYCSGELEFTPGSASSYSDANYYLLATIVERVTGLSFEEALSQWILTPLGMVNTGIIREELIIDRRAYGYVVDRGGYHVPPHINYEDTQMGAGDMFSTVGDLFLFDQSLYGESLLSASGAASLFTSYAKSGFPEMSNGYGWNIGVDTLRDSRTELRICHAPGNNNGFATVLVRIPDYRQTVIISENAGPGWLDMKVFEMSRDIVNLLSGESYHTPKPSIVTILTKTLASEGITAAEQRYSALVASGDYDLDERGINRLGYRYLADGNLSAAVTVFRWNVRSFPKSANAHDSLGEAYASLGNVRQAIVHYEKSLEFDPSNDNARQALNQLIAR